MCKRFNQDCFDVCSSLQQQAPAASSAGAAAAAAQWLLLRLLQILCPLQMRVVQ
jgi:hypothetical protein